MSLTQGSISGRLSYTVRAMTYYRAAELAASFRAVRNNTIQVAADIPEEHYGFRAAPDVRPVAEILVHIAISTRFHEKVHFVEHRTTMAGFDFFAFRDLQAAEIERRRSKAEIVELLRSEGQRFAAALDGSSESFLAEMVDFPQNINPPKSRFELLLGAKEHEMHHRAQLMLVERILGITPHLSRVMEERLASMKAARAAG